MGETLLLVMVLLLSLYGCMELVRFLALRLLRPGKNEGGVLVLPFSGHRDDVEFQVRSAAVRSRWSPALPSRVLVLDGGMDPETRALAEQICRQYDHVRLGTPEEFEKMFDFHLQPGR